MPTTVGLVIRFALSTDLPTLREVERAAGAAFREIGMAAIADDAVAVDAPGGATVQELHLALIHALCRAFDEITGVGSA